MAWTEQCKIVFKTTADAMLWKQKGRRGITKVLKQLSEESGIPRKTLERWYYQLEAEKRILKNEEKKSQTVEITQDTTPEIIKNRRPQGGGKREGAGRKVSKEHNHTPVLVRWALDFADIAISQLTRIEKDDPLRAEALNRVKNWIEEQLKGES